MSRDDKNSADWKAWAESQGIQSDVITFVSQEPARLDPTEVTIDPAKLFSTFQKITEIKVSFDDWKTWAETRDTHPDVIAYLSENQDKISIAAPGNECEVNPKRSPRTWDMVSKRIRREEAPAPMTAAENLIYPTVEELLGAQEAATFKAFRFRRAT